MHKSIIIGTLIMSIALFGCSERRSEGSYIKDNKEIKDALKVLGQERIFFGHQSVGANILDGLESIMNENPEVNLNLLNWTDSIILPQNYFIGGFIGENLNPASKFDDYARIVGKLSQSRLDIALMKLCYVDITQQTDIDKIFNEYISIIDSLKRKYPATKFVHVTVPLTTEADIVRRIYRSIRGQTIDHVADNVARERYNEKLRKHFISEPIFDLAVIESTYPNGSRERGQASTAAYYSLVREYAADEGHLNESGRKIVARELARSLAQVIRDRTSK